MLFFISFSLNKSFPHFIKEEHPNPGTQYKGIYRSGYVPNNAKGRLVAKLLNVAFSRRLVFTIGNSRTTGEDGVITWNDIHHKTRIHGGPQRYVVHFYLTIAGLDFQYFPALNSILKINGTIRLKLLYRYCPVVRLSATIYVWSFCSANYPR